MAAELICDGVHVHPALMAMAIRAKTARRMMAITDGTAGAGLPPGSRTRIGDRPIVVTDRCALLEDGTLAGSILSMDGAFRTLVNEVKLSLSDASRMCSTTPAEELGLGRLRLDCVGKAADLVVLTRDLRVRQTYLAGEPILKPLTTLGTSGTPASVYYPEGSHAPDCSCLCIVAYYGVVGCEVNLQTEGLSARETKTFKVTGQPQLVLDTFDGAIELHSWDRPEVEVEIEKRAMEQTLLDEIKIDIAAERRRHHRSRSRARRARSSAASPSACTFHRPPVFAWRCRATATSRRPAATARSAPKRSMASSCSPPLTAASSARGSAATSRFAPATAPFVSTTPPATSISKPPTAPSVLDVKPTVLKARTGDGSIRATIEPDTVMTDNWDLTTSDGTVVLTLPGLFNAELDAETSDGSVRTSHPLLERRPRRAP